MFAAAGEPCGGSASCFLSAARSLKASLIKKCRKFTLFRNAARAARGAACMRRTRRKGSSSPFLHKSIAPYERPARFIKFLKQVSIWSAPDRRAR